MNIPHSPDRAERRRRHGGEPCVVCGREVKNPSLFLECIGGGESECVLPGTADVADPGYMGLLPIGQCCLRRHPGLKPYVVKG